MARPRHEQPTPAELEFLKILWDRDGPSTVRDVLEVVNRDAGSHRAYTSVMSLLNVMTDKGLLRRAPQGRAFLYEPVSPREQTLRSLLGETLERVYNGSASLLVAHLLDQSDPSVAELAQIRSLLDEYQDRRAGTSEKGGLPCDRSRSKRSAD
jgi:BlaI family transcriptional regulator, penicillinase repressor